MAVKTKTGYNPMKNVHKKGDGERVLENVESFLSREECVP
jgi:hypothetical protein